VPENLHHVKKTKLKFVEALPRKLKNTLSVSKQASKQINVHDYSKTKHRRNFIDPSRPIEELIRFWA